VPKGARGHGVSVSARWICMPKNVGGMVAVEGVNVTVFAAPAATDGGEMANFAAIPCPNAAPAARRIVRRVSRCRGR
jgi:hypothetical protein